MRGKVGRLAGILAMALALAAGAAVEAVHAGHTSGNPTRVAAGDEGPSVPTPRTPVVRSLV